MAEIIVIAIIVAIIVLAFGIGANDETFAPVVGAGTFSVRKASLIAGLLAIIGTVYMSGNVGKTIGTGLLAGEVKQNYDQFMMLAIVLATAILLIGGSTLGIPLSTTHIVIAAVLGIAATYAVRRGIPLGSTLNPESFLEILLSWIISPALGYFGAWGLHIVMRKAVYSRIKGLDDVDKMEKYSAYALIVTIMVTQLSRGGNDAAKATGMLYWLAEGGIISQGELDLLIWGAAIAMGLGLIIIGRRLLRRVGTSVIELRPTTAFTLQLFVAIILFACTVWGLPVSGTHILIFAMLGIRRGLEESMEKQQRRSLYRMIGFWLLTFPLGALISAGIYSLFLLIP